MMVAFLYELLDLRVSIYNYNNNLLILSNNAKKKPNGVIYHLVLWIIILNLVICIKISSIFIIFNLTHIFNG